MPTVEYPFSLDYKAVPGLGRMPAVEVVLKYAGHEARAVAVMDSGSALTVFGHEYALALGIPDVTVGRQQAISTLGGGIDCYMFDVEMEIRVKEHSNRFQAQIGFFAGRVRRNILGRNIFFAHYQLGFHESQQVIHIRPED